MSGQPQEWGKGAGLPANGLCVPGCDWMSGIAHQFRIWVL